LKLLVQAGQDVHVSFGKNLEKQKFFFFKKLEKKRVECKAVSYKTIVVWKRKNRAFFIFSIFLPTKNKHANLQGFPQIFRGRDEDHGGEILFVRNHAHLYQ
jgi:hypothetical protein